MNVGRSATLGWMTALLSAALVACTQPTGTPPAMAAGTHLEAEQGEIQVHLTPQTTVDSRAGGRPIFDPNASGGRAVILLGTNDRVVFQVPTNLPAGPYRVAVQARGELYQGAPVAALAGAGSQRLGTVTVDNPAYAARAFGVFSLMPGQSLTVSYVNDLYAGPGRDRNLILDYLVLEPATAASGPYHILYGSPFSASGATVTADANGHAYTAGTGLLPDVPPLRSDGLDAYVRKVDGGGHTLWSRAFGPSDGAITPMDSTLDAQGHLLVAGTVTGPLAGQTHRGGADGFVVTYRPDGTFVSARQFGTAADETFRVMRLDASGNVYTLAAGTGTLTKWSTSGTVLWARTIAGATSLDVDAGGSAYVVGGASAPGPDGLPVSAYFVARYSPAGQQLWWQRRTDNGQILGTTGVAVSADGAHLYVSGTTNDAAHYGTFIAQVRASDGAAGWVRAVGPSYDSVPGAIVALANGTAALSWNERYDGSDAQIQAVDKDGRLLGRWQQAAINELRAVDLAADPQGNIYGAGSVNVGNDGTVSLDGDSSAEPGQALLLKFRP